MVMPVFRKLTGKISKKHIDKIVKINYNRRTIIEILDIHMK